MAQSAGLAAPVAGAGRMIKGIAICGSDDRCWSGMGTAPKDGRIIWLRRAAPIPSGRFKHRLVKGRWHRDRFIVEWPLKDFYPKQENLMLWAHETQPMEGAG